MSTPIQDHRDRLNSLRIWADSAKPATEKSDSVYIASCASVIGLGLIWTVASQYWKKDDTNIPDQSITQPNKPTVMAFKKKKYYDYDLESDDDD